MKSRKATVYDEFYRQVTEALCAYIVIQISINLKDFSGVRQIPLCRHDKYRENDACKCTGHQSIS